MSRLAGRPVVLDEQNMSHDVLRGDGQRIIPRRADLRIKDEDADDECEDERGIVGWQDTLGSASEEGERATTQSQASTTLTTLLADDGEHEAKARDGDEGANGEVPIEQPAADLPVGGRGEVATAGIVHPIPAVVDEDIERGEGTGAIDVGQSISEARGRVSGS
jgi:hypothetical protein